MRIHSGSLILAAAALCLSLFPARALAQTTPPCAPAAGALVLVGGGANRPAFMDRFMQLAGGAKARIVVIPSALDDAWLTADRMGQLLASSRRIFGPSAQLLHTHSRAAADSAAFVQPLRNATGVWILGGDETLLAGAYAGTRTQTEIKAVLGRGGVVGGTSAGAMIAGAVLVTGKASPLAVTGTRPAFNLLPDSYIVPHWSQRKLNFDLLAAAFAKYPSRTGIGIDEAIAAIVQGGTLEIAGDGRVGIYDGKDHNGTPYALLSSGQKINLPTCA